MRRTWRSSSRGLAQRCRCSAALEQLVVGDAAPQEERQPRRERDVIDAVRCVRARRRADRAPHGTGTPGSRAGLSAPPGYRRRSCLRQRARDDRNRAAAATSASATGRRYACRARFARIVLAQTRRSRRRLARLGLRATSEDALAARRLAGPCRVDTARRSRRPQIRPDASFGDIEAARERAQERLRASWCERARLWRGT